MGKCATMHYFFGCQDAIDRKSDFHGTSAGVWCCGVDVGLRNSQVERLHANTQHLLRELGRLGDLYKTLKYRGTCFHIPKGQKEILS